MEKETERQPSGPINSVSGSKGKRLSKGTIAFAVVAVAIILLAGMAILYPGNRTVHNNNGSSPSLSVEVTNVNLTTVSVPLSSISQNATWYDYNISGSTVRFFAVEDANGVVHTAFDECWMCFNAHLGYGQVGSSMLENCCNMTFPIDQITEEGCSGMGCCPIFLKSTIVGDDLIIEKSELAKQRFIFLVDDETAKVNAFNSTYVAIPFSSVGDNATWYRYDIGGTQVRFFAVKDANGTIHTAFDGCGNCYLTHQGFRQEGAAMVENCCNMPFAIVNITASVCSGDSCHPSYLANQIIGDQVVISVSDLGSGAYMFE